jgi:hypothetical protein
VPWIALPVPKENLVGGLNKGWEVTKYLLGHEREMISDMGLGSGGGPCLSKTALASIGVARTGGLGDMPATPLAVFRAINGAGAKH